MASFGNSMFRGLLLNTATPFSAVFRSPKSCSTFRNSSLRGSFLSLARGNQLRTQSTTPPEWPAQQFGSGDSFPPQRQERQFRPRLMKRVLHIRRVARVNSGGKVRSVSALVVVGNGNGAAGYGEGRAVEAAAAVQKATKVAEKNMTYFDRYNKRTVFGNIDFNWHNVRLHINSAPPGYGIVANNHIHEVCRCIGISDLAATVHGSTNPLNVIKATFEALKTQKRPEEIARMRGKKVEDVETRYYGYAPKTGGQGGQDA